MRIEDPLQAVDLLYRAATEPELWPDALQGFSQAVGCVGMAMIPITPNNTTGLVVSPAMRDVETAYKQEWWRHDSRVGRIFARRLHRGVFCEAELFREEELRRDPFRQEFCRAFDIGAFAVQLVEPWPGHVVAFSGQRRLKLGHFDGEELRTLKWLGRHAARALGISLRLSASEDIARGLLDTVEKFDAGVFVLNARHEIMLMNRSAEMLLGDGLKVIARRLFAASSDRQKALDLLIASAFAPKEGHADIRPVALPRPSGKKHLLVQTVPLRPRDRSGRLGGDQARVADSALLLVVDPDGGCPAPHEALRLLGLTGAEARIAALVGSGMRRRDAAFALGIAEWTARDTLKTVYSKLGIGSQGELARLVGRIAAVEGSNASDA